jgi:hypothetical protein
VLRLLIMLETSLITVIYKRIGKFWYITQSELFHSVVFTILQSERNLFLEKGLLSYMFRALIGELVV